VRVGRALLGLSYATGLPFVAELGARWALRRWGGYYAHPPHTRLEYAFDTTLLPQFPPTARCEINALGERGGPPPEGVEPTLRVLVAGGSAAQCQFLDQDATWSAVAQRLLEGHEHIEALGVRRVHVGNASRPILRCDDLAFLLAKILPRYTRVDVIALMAGAADVLYWVERGMPPELPIVPVDLDKIFEQHPEGPWGWQPSETALSGLARRLYRRAFRPVRRVDDCAGWMRKLRLMRAAAPHRLDIVPDPAPMLEHFEKGLRSLIAVARRCTERIVMVRQPWFGPNPSPDEESMFWNFGMGRPYRELVSTYLTPRAVDALMRAADERSSMVAASEGIVQVDTMATLGRTSQTLYDELHLTPAGAEAVGRLAADGILASLRRWPLDRAAAASPSRSVERTRAVSGGH
jgi:hypothetical protein